MKKKIRHKKNVFSKIINREKLTITEKIGLSILLIYLYFLIFFAISMHVIISIILTITTTILSLVLYIFIKKRKTNTYITRDKVEEIIQYATPFEFEEIITNMYQRLGYKTKLTPPRKDNGADVILTKKGKKYVVQVKHYKEENKINRQSLQQLQGSAKHYHAHGMKFITSGFYTSSAKDYSYQHGIEILNYDELVDIMLRSYRRKKQKY